MERVFRTLQDRLPKELRLAGFGAADAPADLAAVNRFLREVYVPQHNARFAVAAEQPGSAFVPVQSAQWQDVLCIQEDRVVANDNTVRYQGRVLQIPESPLRRHFVRATVRVHDYADATLALFHGPRCIARFDAAGAPLTAPPRATSQGAPACGYVDDARASPTSPQAPPQPQKESKHELNRKKRTSDPLRQPDNLTS